MLLNTMGIIRRHGFALILLALALFAVTASGAFIQATATNKFVEGMVYCPDISPDGKAIVFTRTEGAGHIVLMDTASLSTQTIHAAGATPRFSPKGDRICFMTGQNIAVMQRDGSGIRILATNLYLSNPHWAPDGKTIYYCAFQNNKLGVLSVDTETGAGRIVSQRNEIDVAPSPDGKYLAFVVVEPNGARTLGVMGVDGGNPRLIQRGNMATSVASSGYFAPCWAPDGKWILMVCSQMQPLDNLVAISIDGRQRVELTADSARNATPVWSRDGKTIVFTKLVKQDKQTLQTLYSLTVAVDSKGIEDRLATLGSAYDVAVIQTSEKAVIPPLVGPDIKAPLDVKPLPGTVESVCLNGRWEAVLKAGTNLPGPQDKSWKPHGIPASAAPHRGGAWLPAWFRVQFMASAEYQSRPYAELDMTCMDGEATFYLNGAKVGESFLPNMPVRVRVDQALRWGQTNELHVFVKPGRGITYPQNAIPGDVFLKFYPALYIDNIIVRTSVRKRTIESRVYVRNLTKRKAKVTLTGAIQEEDGRTALDFESQLVTVPPGTMTEVLFTKAWTNAALWGFGNYGTPHLYFARHGIEQKGLPPGNAFARFGFREFWGEGTQFMLNGKPLWIKGDLCSEDMDYQNRGFVQRYFQFLREGNINFLRHHTPTFENDVWFEVADEVGMLVEPQLLITAQGPTQNYDAQLVDAQWRQFIWKHANHPGIVMYSGDNECLSGYDTPRLDVYSLMNMRGKLLYTLDPTRMVEWHGSPGIAIAAAMGLYENLQVWNTHPYGTPLGEALKRHMQMFPYNGKIPVHIGEIFITFGGSPFNWWTKPAEIVRSKTLQDAYAGVGTALGSEILSIAEAGACGGSLCAAQGLLQFGTDGKGGFAFGPWQKEAIRADRVTPDGKPVVPGIEPSNESWKNVPSVEIKWPSLSGLGMRPTSAPAGEILTGVLVMNWFDPSRPAYTFNLAMLDIGDAFREVDGLEPGPLTAPLKPEVVVMFAPNDTPAAGVFVKVAPLARQPWTGISIMTDPDGTAWFVLPAAGRYQASATWNGKTYTQTFLAKTTPFPPREVSGYGHVQFVDLAGNRAGKMRTEWLPRPAKVTISGPTNIVYGPDDPQSQEGKPHLPTKGFVGGPYYPDSNGFIRNWLVCGPFPNVFDPAKKVWRGLATDYLKEADTVPTFGQRHKVSFPAGQSWKPGETEVFWDFLASLRPWIDLCVLTAPEMDIIAPPSNVVGYAVCYVDVDEDVDLQLALEFDDAGKAVLNGATVADFPGDGSLSNTTRWVARKDKHVVPVRLKQGRNRLLLKVGQNTDYYGFYCRFLKDNKPFMSYTVWLKASGGADTHYVDPNNRNPVPPYTNGWASAATNIQAVINQSPTLDSAVILVAGGVYRLTSPITINKGIILKAASTNRADTVLCGNTSNQCLIINHRGARVEGFTITGGRCPALANTGGGGLKLTLGTVANCTIESNSSAVSGGGVYMNKDCLLTNCSVLNNTAEGGGGIFCNKGGEIRNCIISGNYGGGNTGGGIWFYNGGGAVFDSVISMNSNRYYGGGVGDCGLVQNCVISNNVTTLHGGGAIGGIVRNSQVVGNRAGQLGGGIFLGSLAENCVVSGNFGNMGGGIISYGNGGVVRNCLIAGNRAGQGGGVWAGYAAVVGGLTMLNCTIAGNTAESGGGIYVPESATLSNRFINTIVYGNTQTGGGSSSNWSMSSGYVCSNCCTAPTNGLRGAGNIADNPAFINPDEGNYRLASNSPCINTGINQDWMTNGVDLEGETRILPREGGPVDIGAYEYSGPNMEHQSDVALPFGTDRRSVRGTQNALIDVMDQNDSVQGLLRRIHEFYLKELEFWVTTNVDAVCLMDDWGAQRQLLIPPDIWRELFKPLYKDYCDLAHSRGKFVFMHSDGNITEIYPDIVEIGIDALNSQLFCMDLAELARIAKGKITFWGEIDRQQVLPSLDPQAGRNAVRKVAQHLYDPAGGIIAHFELGKDANPYTAIAVFEEWEQVDQEARQRQEAGATNAVFKEIPPVHYAAMVKAWNEYGGGP